MVDTGSLNLQISLDGVHFAAGQFPPNMKPETHVCAYLPSSVSTSSCDSPQAYTILDSSTASLFVHMTMAEPSDPRSQSYWGNILKSNSNGTYFGLSAENVNRDRRGYVDFEKVVGLDGIALINVVSNPEEALLTGRKVLQSRITHNDGISLSFAVVPPTDALQEAPGSRSPRPRTIPSAMHTPAIPHIARYTSTDILSVSIHRRPTAVLLL